MLSCMPGCFGAYVAVLLSSSVANAATNRWESAGIGGGGSFYEPSLSPLAKGEIFVTSDMSGLYHSRDDGEKFTMTYSATIDGGPGCRVQFTPVKDWLYTVDKKYPGGLPACSLDGGASWTGISPDPTAAATRRLFTDELGGKMILVADKTALYASAMPSAATCATGSLNLRMVYNSTKGELFASGAFFQPPSAASDEPLSGADASQIVLVGTAQGVLFSSKGSDFSLLASSGIPDGDAILSFSAGQLADGSIALHAVTAHLTDITDEVLMERNEGLKLGQGVFRATLPLGVQEADVGTLAVTWKSAVDGLPPLLSAGGKAGSVGANVVACAATDGDTVYLSSNNGTSGAPLIYKSEKGDPWRSVFGSAGNTNIAIGYEGDGGYAPLTGGFGWSWGGGAEGFTVCANDPNRLAFSDTGFFHGSNDGGQSFHALYVKPEERNPPGQPVPPGKAYATNGLEDTSSWYLHWFDEKNIFAGYTDIRGLRSVTGGRTWSYNYTGHDLNTMYHAQTSGVSGVTYAATSGTHDMYQDTHVTPAVCDKGEGRVISSIDKGGSWQLVHDFGHPVTMVATSPTQPHTVYAAVVDTTTGGIWVSDDVQKGNSSAWRKMPAPKRTLGHAYNIHALSDGSLVATFSCSMDEAKETFTDSAGVFVWAAGATGWEDRSHPRMHYWTKDLVVDPNDKTQSTWYVGVFRNWGDQYQAPGGLFRTTNRGKSWTELSNVTRVDSCAISPTNPDQVFFTTDGEGLWVSNDATSAKPTFVRDDRYDFGHPSRVFFDPYDTAAVWATSFGSGLRRLVLEDEA